MFTVVSAEVVARKLIKDNEKIRKLVKIKNNKMPTGTMRLEDECFQCFISSHWVKGKLL